MKVLENLWNFMKRYDADAVLMLLPFMKFIFLLMLMNVKIILNWSDDILYVFWNN